MKVDLIKNSNAPTINLRAKPTFKADLFDSKSNKNCIKCLYSKCLFIIIVDKYY